MDIVFARALSQLRHEKGVSQRQAAKELNVSQALLSHYENGIREPGLAFVVRACDYYEVSADYLLGRTERDCVLGNQSSGGAAALALMRTADVLSRACMDLSREDPALKILFRRMAGQLCKEFKSEAGRGGGSIGGKV